MGEISKDLDKIERDKIRLEVEERLAIQKAIESNDPDDIIKATVRWNDIEQKDKVDVKSMIFDPMLYSSGTDWKYKPQAMSFSMLRRMAKTPIVAAIIGTRVEQVAAYCRPRSDKFGVGFEIRKKAFYKEIDDTELTEQDNTQIQKLTEFILNCGSQNNSWGGDDFVSFIRKITQDSLVLDQMCFEIVRNYKGEPIEFIATDGATYRLAENYQKNKMATWNAGMRQYDDFELRTELINGYAPAYVQVFKDRPITDFYPWELCLGMRNTSTDIYRNGYGRSELEDLVEIVTWMLYGDSYNGKFFSQGSAPKGLLKVAGNVNSGRLQEFKQQWGAMMAGVGNAHKTPVIESDKMEWIDMQKSNRDMEFQKWQEYLVKITCAVYKISPDEIGFSVGGGTARVAVDTGKSMAEKLAFSKDKGLRPLLKFIESKINKYIINPLDQSYEFKFMGMDSEDEKTQVDLDIRKGSAFMGYKELRKKYGLPEELDKDDFIMSPTFLQYQQIQMMGGGESNDAIDEEFGEDEQSRQFEEMREMASMAADEQEAQRDSNEMERSIDYNPLIEDFNEFLKADNNDYNNN